MLELAVSCETLVASGCTRGRSSTVVTPGLAATTLAKHGTEEQRRAILPGIVDGSVQFCLELTEPDAGSNVIAISSTARRNGADLLLRGQTGVANADWMID